MSNYRRFNYVVFAVILGFLAITIIGIAGA